MYSLCEVEKALENENLSDALYKLHRFANSEGFHQLSSWCMAEMNGYVGRTTQQERDQSRDYRTVTVQ